MSDLAKQIYEESHISGKFLLRSGKVSNEYFDKYLFKLNPLLLNKIFEELEKLISAGTAEGRNNIEKEGLRLYSLYKMGRTSGIQNKCGKIFPRIKIKNHLLLMR